MLETYCRPYCQRIFINPLALLLIRIRGLSPNHLSLLALICGLATVPLLYLDAVNSAIALIIVSGYLDMLDGTIARMLQCSSAKGTMIDIMSDRLVEFAVILGLLLVDPVNRAVECVIMLGSVLICVTSFLTVGVFHDKIGSKSFFYSPGLIERSEAFIFFIAMIKFPTLFNQISIIFSLLIFYTALKRSGEFILSPQINRS